MKALLLLTLVSSISIAGKQGPLDACRIDLKSSKVHCQHIRNRGMRRRERALKTVDRWIAVPCKQLRRRIPEISCKKTLSELRLGEPITD